MLAAKLAKIHAAVEALQAELDRSVEKAENPNRRPVGPDLIFTYNRDRRMPVSIMVEGTSSFWDFRSLKDARQWLSQISSLLHDCEEDIAATESAGMTLRLPTAWSI
jgi:hypothetical protein